MASTLLRSQVGYLSGNRCKSACSSGGREFDPGPVPSFVEIDHEIISTVILLSIGHSPLFRWIIIEGLSSVTSESMCTKYWLTACSSLPRKKCSKVNWPSRHDHSCWLGTSSNKQTNKQTNKMDGPKHFWEHCWLFWFVYLYIFHFADALNFIYMHIMWS